MNKSSNTHREVVAISAGITGVGVFVTFLYRLWDLEWSVPLNYRGDSLLTLNTISNILHFGSYAHNNHLGYPFGQNLLDFPANGDVFSLGLIRVLTFFTPQPGLILNILFILTYFLVFVGSYVGFRIIRLPPLIAAGLAILYSFIPYHQLRGVPHVFLCMYCFIPIWCSILIRELGSYPVSETMRLKGWKVSSAVFASVGFLAATTGIYYTVFYLCLTTSVAIVNAVRKRWTSVGALLIGLSAASISVIVEFWNVLVFHQTYGGNPSAIIRSLDQVQYWSLKPFQLFLPIEQHRLPFVRNWINSREPFVRSGEFGTSMGFLLSVGLILSLVSVIRRLRSPGRPLGERDTSFDLGVLVTITLIIGATGGLGFLLGLFGFVEIRVWERIVVLIAFLSCSQIGYLLANRSKPTTKVRRIAFAILVVLALLDMTPSDLVAGRAAIERSWKADRELASAIEAHFGSRAKVAQLPLVVFPENGPREQMVDYDHLRGYLHLPDAFFSYGSVKGRGGRWQEKLSGDPKLQLDQLIYMGFEALWFDTRGFAYDSLLPNTFRDNVGRENLVIRRDAVEIYDLRKLRESIVAFRGADYLGDLKAAVLSPLFFYYGGFSGVETNGTNYWVTAGRESQIVLVNTSANRKPARLRFKASPLAKSSLIIQGPCKEGGSRMIRLPAVISCTLRIGTKAVKLSLTTTERQPRRDLPPSRLLQVSETTFNFLD